MYSVHTCTCISYSLFHCLALSSLPVAAARGATDPLKIKEGGSDPLKIQQPQPLPTVYT